MNIYAFTARLK